MALVTTIGMRFLQVWGVLVQKKCVSRFDELIRNLAINLIITSTVFTNVTSRVIIITPIGFLFLIISFSVP